MALAGFKDRQNTQSKNASDGVLTALEVAGLSLRGTKLVVLSACETGKGTVKLGEGIYGLRRALVIAGSQSQVLSLWKVSDEGTKDLMVKYYANLKAGKGRHEALREVQLELINNPKYQHPYYWSSFIPSGNWKEMDANFSSYLEKPILIFIIGLSFTFAIIISSKFLIRKQWKKSDNLVG